MKKVFLLLAVALLTGCSTINEMVDAFLIKYDTNEYKLINDIRTLSSVGKNKCDDPVESKKIAERVAYETLTLRNYTEHLPHNRPMYGASLELDNIASGLRNSYQSGNTVSPVFCKIKFQVIESAAVSMQKQSGAKPK
jgi:hypothetical protein